MKVYIAAFQKMKEDYMKDEDRVFTSEHSDRTRGKEKR